MSDEEVEILSAEEAVGVVGSRAVGVVTDSCSRGKLNFTFAAKLYEVRQTKRGQSWRVVETLAEKRVTHGDAISVALAMARELNIPFVAGIRSGMPVKGMIELLKRIG